MTSDQLEQLLHESESPYLDFKRDQYRFVGATDEEKSELLKDILAFANAWRRTDAFILIGVEEVKGERGRIQGVSWNFDDAMLQQFVNGKTQRAIDFSVETMTVDTKKLDVIKIPLQRRPFYLKKDFAKLKAGTVYFRRGTSTAEANPDEIAAMGEDGAQPKSPEPMLEFQFAENRASLQGGRDLKALGPLVTFEMEALDVELLQKTFNPNPWLATKPQRSGNILEKVQDSFRTLERNRRLSRMTRALHFAVSNSGTVSAVNVEAHLLIPRKLGLVLTTAEALYPVAGSSIDNLLEKIKKGFPFQTKPDSWQLKLTFERILPGHVIFSPDIYYLGATQTGRWHMEGTIYGDNLLKPHQSRLELAIHIAN